MLILDHISKRVVLNGLAAMPGTMPEHREQLFSSVVGIGDHDDKYQGEAAPEHLDSSAIMAMTDEQRMDVYNKIISQVMGTDNYELKSTD